MSKKLNLSQANVIMQQHAERETAPEVENKVKDVKPKKVRTDYDFSKKRETRSVSLQCLLDPTTSELLTNFAKEHKTSKNEIVIRAVNKFINEY